MRAVGLVRGELGEMDAGESKMRQALLRLLALASWDRLAVGTSMIVGTCFAWPLGGPR
jgi:hypothetical protein